MNASANPVARGTVLRGRIVVAFERAADGSRMYRYGDYRVTAVRGGRVYVSHVSGHQYCGGVNGYVNQWIAVGDLDRFTVVTSEVSDE